MTVSTLANNSPQPTPGARFEDLLTRLTRRGWAYRSAPDMLKRANYILVFLVLLIGVGCASQRSPTQGEAGAYSGPRIVDLAVSMQGCYADEVGTNLTAWPFALARYLKKSGPGPHDYEPWCSEFVCWAYAAAGAPLASRWQHGWMMTDNQQLRAWFIKHGRFVYKEDPAWVSLIPQPGDYVHFNNAAGGHSAIVRSVSGSDLNVVSGSSGNRVRLDTVKDFRSSTMIDGVGLRGGSVRAMKKPNKALHATAAAPGS